LLAHLDNGNCTRVVNQLTFRFLQAKKSQPNMFSTSRRQLHSLCAYCPNFLSRNALQEAETHCKHFPSINVDVHTGKEISFHHRAVYLL
jgi:hypothetical protein